MLNQIIHNDCLEVLKDIPDNYFDSLITDAPAGIHFMGKEFDHNKGGMLNWINWLSEIMSESLRVMKPGACGLAWSIPRTSHWTGMALELAGFKIIDIVHHVNGMGFPKGQCLSKQIDQLLGEEREVIGRKTGAFMLKSNEFGHKGVNGTNHDIPVSIPSSPEAKFWDGWKTPALKPAVEGWWLVQKPISESSIARNILKHGVGGLNIEASRVGTKKEVPASISKTFNNVYSVYGKETGNEDGHNPNIGRFPSNLILSCGANCIRDDHSPDCPISVIGEQSGVLSVCGSPKKTTHNKGMFGIGTPGVIYKDKGTAARFFKNLPFDPETIPSIYYQSKASPKDRSSNGKVKNIHPTVKSRHLMKYLITLITPKDGIVLDPFCGSGTTAIACKELGFNYVCIEKEKEYFDIACDRINQVRDYSGDKEDIKEEDIKEEIKNLEDNQLSLF
jgi:DNA modification methylase